MERLYPILLAVVIVSVVDENYSKHALHDGITRRRSNFQPNLQQPADEYVLNMSPCGRPLPGNESACQPFSKLQYPKCQSFPGKPQRVEVYKIYNHSNPMVTVGWDAPSTGFNDLWGFQVQIIDLTLSHPSSKCHQINIKVKRRYFKQLIGLSYGGIYQIRVQSMPSDGNKSIVVYNFSIPDKCNIPALRLISTRFCCQFSKVLSQVYQSTVHDAPIFAINITWKLNNCNEIRQYNLKWNTSYDASCDGIVDTKADNYTIILPKICTEEQHNYTAQIYGITLQNTTTEIYMFWFTVPSKSSLATPTAPTSRSQSSSSNITIIAAVVSTGIVIGILLVVLLFVFRQRATVIRIVDNYHTPQIEEEQILPDPIKVLILYKSCCVPCKKVIYSLWDVLSCTNLFDVRLDMLSEPKLNENPLRWYELQVKEAARIILVTSRLMMTADLNPTADNTVTGLSDYVSIGHQLNLLRGEICTLTNTSKFVPVYLSYNGSKKDIPRFLSMCRTYKLAQELDKIMLHLLGMSSVRKHSKRPLLEISSDSHPFNEKKAALEKALTDAEHFHKHVLSQCPSLQSNCVV